jgi:hypothetical protein
VVRVLSAVVAPSEGQGQGQGCSGREAQADAVLEALGRLLLAGMSPEEGAFEINNPTLGALRGRRGPGLCGSS